MFLNNYHAIVYTSYHVNVKPTHMVHHGSTSALLFDIEAESAPPAAPVAVPEAPAAAPVPWSVKECGHTLMLKVLIVDVRITEDAVSDAVSVAVFNVKQYYSTVIGNACVVLMSFAACNSRLKDTEH